LGMLVLKKINETFPSVDITFNVKTKWKEINHH
jgi:hypothetical protein